jgi:tetratricopeptide (TPR) repeat protein
VEDGGVQPRRFGERFLVAAGSEIGVGGMGTVFRGVDLLTGQDVALKVLQETASPERFVQEAALLSELAHPAVVRYIDHGITAAGERYLAMEWLEGETLEARLARGPVGVAAGLRLARRLLDGLAVAHRKGIVHRDLKPGNIFLPAGDLSQAKLLDFGIARRAADTRRVTMTGASLGTPAHMSPEQARGARTLDARSDIFSLGTVLWECLTGEPLFTGGTGMAIMARIALDETTSLLARRPDLPGPVTALLARMLARDPADRPAAAELAAVIDSAGEVLPGARPLATGEQRVVCAIVVSRPTAQDGDATRVGTWDVPASLTATPTLTGAVDGTLPGQLQQAVAPFGGRVEVLSGSTLAVTLSAEVTPSDLAPQAARCALVCKGLLPGACLALATGRAGMGAGDEGPGELVAAAIGLLSGAGAGEVRLDDPTAALLESRFEVGHQASRHQLLFEKGLREAPRTVLGKPIACIGRDREIASLLALWGEASGEPVARAALVTAPAGGGKSRLRHEAIERIEARQQPFTLLLGRGDSVRAGAPHALLGPALRAAAGLLGGERPAIQQKRMTAHVARHLAPGSVPRVAAFLGEIAGVHFPDHELPALRAARQDPRLMADQILAAWLDYIQAECAARPVLLVFEDLHFGDVPSVQLVDAALRTLPDSALLVLAFARPEVDDRFPGVWAGRDLQRIALPPLTARAAGRLVQEILGTLPAEQAAWIVERADGNPFYLEELARAVGAGATAQALPDTITGMVQARFDALGPEAKRVLRAASIFGSRFRAAGVRALIGDDDQGLDRWLEILASKEIVFPRQAADGREYVFRHALLEEAAYAMLTPPDRVRGHRLAGEHLEQQGEQAAIVLVDHFDKGEQPERAAHWCRFASEQAADANDLAAALARVERGVALGAEGEALAAMRIVEASARYWRGEYREAEQAATTAVDALTGAGRLRAIRVLLAALGQLGKYEEVRQRAEALLQETPPAEERAVWLECLGCAAAHLMPAGLYDDVVRLRVELERHEQELDPAARARLFQVRAIEVWHDGHVGEAIPLMEAASRDFEAVGDLRSQTEMTANVGSALGDLGLLEQAEARMNAVLVASERMQLGSLSAFALMNLSHLRTLLGRPAEGRAAGTRAVALTRAQGNRRVEGLSHVCLSRAASTEGDFSQAEAHARAATEILRDVLPVLPEAIAVVAETLLSQRRAEDALLEAGEAYRLLLEIGRVEDGEALVRLTYAECLMAQGRQQEAAAIIQTAHQRLIERAALIADPDWRQAFLSRNPVHARTVALAGRLR